MPATSLPSASTFGHEEGKRREVSSVQASRAFDGAGIADAWYRREADRLQWHQRLIAQRGMAAVREDACPTRPIGAPREAALA